MMNWFPQLRALAFLRRIARALERSATAEEELARLARAAVDSAFPAQRRRAKQGSLDIGSLDIAEANKEYHRMRVERGEEDA